MPKTISPRICFAAIGFTCIALLTTAWYLQYGPERQQPCPLCILQRYTYLVLAVVCLLAAAHGPQRTGLLLYTAFAGFFAGSGTSLALWQVTQGASMTSCLADPIGEFVNALPSANWWPEYFYANGGCADQYPPILGLIVPYWSLFWFATFTALITVVLFAILRNKLAA